MQHTRFYMRNLTRMQNLTYVHIKSNLHAEHTKSDSSAVLDSDSSAAQEVQLTCDIQAPTDHSNKIEQHMCEWHT